MRQIRFIILIVLLMPVLFACTPQRKPKPAEPPPLAQLPTPVEDLPLDIMGTADAYARAIAKNQLDKAKKMSSPANRRWLEVNYPAALQKIARQYKIGTIRFNRADFEAALLEGDSYERLVVTHSLFFPIGPAGTGQVYLKFRITKVGKKYLVQSTELLSKLPTPPPGQ
ncbi:hypothetical protein [Carboxydocella sp. ULO1]|uniref:hypothetical protein n=1 Tax=Carboxydocella sp. ULO1 TaxID=1926599 RepID=UPI0009AEBF5F|nr:hypothetical protein [Carboxydocella sp. ULO1]GAW28390.1 hypothetical protein ULO1_09600 [Carboxydocella sp. ULO1]